MTSVLPIVARQLTFAYNEPEDRLTLLAGDTLGQSIHVLMTRRLTERLINGLAQLLEQSSPLAQTAPADLRNDIILMEHQDALFGRTEPGPAVTDAIEPANAAPPTHLILAIDVAVMPQTFEIGLRAGAAFLIRLSLDRHSVHRLVEALSQRAEAAGWNLVLGAPWLEPGQTQIVLN
ncbi:MAG: hypothetical protein K2Y56_02055 [Methylobacterium sp.]|uniref:hypothetical protein n=1 Tax=Methylobacterium sp. TaxID=409 RepID=UPI0025DB0646|nr:hypothetical protein [Methylobacterium sp.]MBX9930315.1 hypothetical protein [Methylobacterium sp.]